MIHFPQAAFEFVLLKQRHERFHVFGVMPLNLLRRRRFMRRAISFRFHGRPHHHGHGHTSWQYAEAVVEDAAAPEHGRGEAKDLAEKILDFPRPTSGHRHVLRKEVVFAESETRDQRHAVLEGLFDETQALGQDQRAGTRASIQSFLRAADDEHHGFAHARLAVRVTQKTVDVFTRGDGKTAEEQDFAQ